MIPLSKFEHLFYVCLHYKKSVVLSRVYEAKQNIILVMEKEIDHEIVLEKNKKIS